MSIYAILRTSLMSAVEREEITPEQARLASNWLAVQEATS